VLHLVLETALFFSANLPTRVDAGHGAEKIERVLRETGLPVASCLVVFLPMPPHMEKTP
jgi:hypothetical protein